MSKIFRSICSFYAPYTSQTMSVKFQIAEIVFPFLVLLGLSVVSAVPLFRVRHTGGGVACVIVMFIIFMTVNSSVKYLVSEPGQEVGTRYIGPSVQSAVDMALAMIDFGIFGICFVALAHFTGWNWNQ